VGDEHGDEPLLDGDLGLVCPLTDGSSHSDWLADCSGACQERRHITIDLGARLLVSGVVVHGLSLTGMWSLPLDVEVSTDGKSFMAVGNFDSLGADEWALVDLAQPTEARFVRVATHAGSSINEVAELSVF